MYFYMERDEFHCPACQVSSTAQYLRNDIEIATFRTFYAWRNLPGSPALTIQHKLFAKVNLVHDCNTSVQMRRAAGKAWGVKNLKEWGAATEYRTWWKPSSNEAGLMNGPRQWPPCLFWTTRVWDEIRDTWQIVRGKDCPCWLVDKNLNLKEA